MSAPNSQTSWSPPRSCVTSSARRGGGGRGGGRGRAVEPRQAHVEEEEVEGPRREEADGALAVLGHRDLVARLPEPLLQDPADTGLVVRDADPRRRCDRALGHHLAMGRKQV